MEGDETINTPNSTIIAGNHDGLRVYVDPKQHQLLIGDSRYSRVHGWLVAEQSIFTPASLSIRDLMELLVASYVKMRELEKQ